MHRLLLVACAFVCALVTAVGVQAKFKYPPHYRAWLCIHHYEGAWNDRWDPYWGGLQMDRGFMLSYGRDMVRRYGGWADRWPPLAQMWVAERAWKTRGFYPWPRTARMCGLI